MARFPLKQSDVVKLAEIVLQGLKDNTDIFPKPYVELSVLADSIERYRKADAQMIQASEAKKKASVNKMQTAQELADAVKSQLRYAEITSGFDDEKLKLVGWAAKNPPTPLPVPGQPLSPAIVIEDDGSVTLSWKRPTKGVKPKIYLVHRMAECQGAEGDGAEGDGVWTPAGSSLSTSMSLADQPKGIRLAFKVIAMNKAGKGPESNTVMAVL